MSTANSVQVADLVRAVANASGLLTPGGADPAQGGLPQPPGGRGLQLPARHGQRGHGGKQTEIVSSLPVPLYPMSLFDSAADLLPGSGFCASLAQQLDAWATARGLPPDYGRWVLDVSLYTTLPGAAGAPPLLELSDVRLDRSVVKPATSAVP